MSLTLLDTNVFVYAFFAQRPEHRAALALLEQAQEDSAGLCVAPQNLAEFYAVTTNPRRVTTPLSGPTALEEVGKLCALARPPRAAGADGPRVALVPAP